MEIIKQTVIIILFFIAFYLIGCFYSATFNIADFTKETRFVIIITYFGFLAIYYMTKQMLKH